LLKVIREVKKSELKDFLYNMDLTDENLYKEANSDTSLGIFQFTGKTANRLLKEVNPSSFEELVAINALSRPGSIEMLPQYLEGMEGKESHYPRELDPILKSTNNTILFQEQIMAIFNKIGNFTLEESNSIRGLMKVLGKKEKKQEDLDAWDRAVKRFIKGAENNNIKPFMAKKLADDMVAFSAYSFNRSHAVAYTLVATMTLYLSYYFRKYFYSAILDYEIDKDNEILTVFNKVKLNNYDIMPPDINESYTNMYPIDNTILYGLYNIKFVGEKPCAKIIENRPYNSLFDFIMKTRSREVNSKTIKALISVGAFDKFEENRKKLLYIFERFWKEKKSIKIVEKLEYIYNNIEKESERMIGLNTTLSDLRKYEKEFFGFNFFTSVFSPELTKAFIEMSKKHLIYFDISDVSRISKKLPVNISSIRTLIDRNGKEMAFLEIEDLTNTKITIPVFGSYWIYIKDMIQEDEIYLLNVYLDDKDNILFGEKSWGLSEGKIIRMVKKVG